MTENNSDKHSVSKAEGATVLSMKLNFLTKTDMIFIGACIIIILFSLYFLFPTVSFYRSSKPYVVLPDLISFIPVLSGAILITIWFLIRGKSIKNFNDFFLFMFAAYVIYLLIYDYQANKEFNSITYLAENITHLSLRVFILMASTAKCLIAFMEGIFEVYKESKRNDPQEMLKGFFSRKKTILVSILVSFAMNFSPFLAYILFYS